MITMVRGVKLACRSLAVFSLFLAAFGVSSAHAADASKYGFERFNAELTTTQAGDHPDFITNFELTTNPAGPTVGGLNPPYATTRNLSVIVPPGLLGNPTNFPMCSSEQFGIEAEDSHCPQDSQIGVTTVGVYPNNTFTEPVFLLEPPSDSDVVARIGFMAGIYPTILNIKVLPEDNYALEAQVEGASALAKLVKAETTLWGVPSDPVHDTERVTAVEALKGETPPGGARESGLDLVPFMTNPTRCGSQPDLRVLADTYQAPGQIVSATASPPSITGCGKLKFPPQFSISPTLTAADSPTGIDTSIFLPQNGLRDSQVLATPHLKKAVVTLPLGMTLNPAAANGLAACTEAQIGLISESPIRFNAVPPSCPAGSKVGTVEIVTPVLEKSLNGSLYLASQSDNPFNTLLSGYLVAEGQGVLLKVAGRFDVSPFNGQITAIFDENPEQPFERLDLHFRGGSGGVLTTPAACGTYTIDSILSPWSATDPFNPTAAEAKSFSNPFALDRGPNGGPCPAGSFRPDFTAGTTDPTAGAYSPFVLRLTREDGSPRLTGLRFTLPKGLTGKLAGIPYCSEAVIAAAAALTQAGQGRSELSHPSCPAESLLGTVTAGVGSGSAPFFVSTGRVYLAGPYKGAPLSFAIVAPAVAGPFDLGAVVVRVAIQVDPQTAELTAVSDPIPTALSGIPLDLRDLRVKIDRSGFTLNPTSCEQMEFRGTAIAGGISAPISERFQAASCASLGFQPKISISLQGGMKRAGHPALRAVLLTRRGDANLHRATVILPHSQFIDQAHISNPCTRVQFAANACPPKSILGKARVVTPLLDQPLEGPVYFRSNGGDRLLPDIVLDLHGQVDLVQVGFVDSVNPKSARIRTTFASTPDAPVSKIVLQMKGGKQGLLQNSENLCARPQRVDLRLTGHNGKTDNNSKSMIKTPCGKRKKR
jgi:hypothetical protein